MIGIEPHEEGLPRKVFNAHLDALIETSELNPEILPFMDASQQQVINEVKKSIIRLQNKYARQIAQDTERA